MLKALFFYNRGDRDHAAIACTPADAFETCGMEVRGVRGDPGEDRSEILAALAGPDDYDVLLVHQHLLCDEVVSCGRPVIVMERVDGAQLVGSRRWIPHVAGVIKGYIFQPPELNNLVNGRWHAHAMAELGMKADNTRALPGQPQPQLSSEELRRIRIGYGFAAYPMHRACVSQFIDWSSRRPYAAHFAGTISYQGTEIELHRRCCADVLGKWCEEHPGEGVCVAGKGLSPTDYLRTMFLSRVVVSPWGWGESCHRDYEAILLGAVLVKPPMSHVRCWPDIYAPGQSCIQCRADFADLPEILARVDREWPDWTERRQKARQLVIDAMHPVRIARHLIAQIKSLL